MSVTKPVFPLHKEESFFLNNFNIDLVFNTIERTDYLFLHYIEVCSQNMGKDEKVYLSVLSEVMHLSIPELSKAIEKLQDKSLVIWKTDSTAGKTYVELSSKAIELMKVEKSRMQEVYQKILGEIGEEDLLQMTQTMKRITEVLKGIRSKNEDGK